MKKLKEKIKWIYLYLAGPIEADTKDGGQSWRNEITPALDALDMYVQDPCRTEPQATGMDVVMAQDQFNKWIISGNMDIFMKKFKIIVDKDIRMVKRSDFIIVHLFEDVVTTGTIHEMAEAWGLNIPIYLIWQNGKAKLSKWALFLTLDSGGKIFQSKNKCMEYIEATYAPEEACIFLKIRQVFRKIGRVIEQTFHDVKIDKMKKNAETKKERVEREKRIKETILKKEDIISEK